jgi:hypothetical protein
VLGLVLVGEAGIEAYVRRSLLAHHIAYFELHTVGWQAVQAVQATLGMAYQLCGGRLATNPRYAEQREKLTSDKLEGLGYELVAVLAIFVVRHDCDG